VCHGKRYNEATLRVRWKDRSIAEVLETSVSEARGLFEHHRGLSSVLPTLEDVG
jgi:excinuclease ABC subunit A